MAKCAFLGLGVMGYPMAGHMAAAGHEVTVYIRSTAKAEKWVAEHGGASASTRTRSRSVSIPRIRPRRADRSPIRSPTCASGACTSRRTSGSRSTRLPQRGAEGLLRAEREGVLTRVVGVGGSVEETDPHVDHGVAEDTGPERRLDALPDARDVLARDRATADPVLEDEAFSGRRRLELHHHVGEEARAAGLLPEHLVDARAGRDRLAVRDAGRADVDGHAVLGGESADRDLEV